MAAFEVIALDTATPQLRAPGAGDTYTHPRQSLFLAGTAAAPGIAGNSDDNTGMLWPAADNLAWATGGSEQMRLTSTGLGIGTSSPGAKLHVVGSVSTGLFEGSTLGGITLQKTSTNGVQLFSDAAGVLKVYNNQTGVTAATLDSSGNLGLGVTPSAWSGFSAIDVNAISSFASASNRLQVAYNSYWNGSNYIYKTTAEAARYDMISGQHQWYIAPSGTAGNVISFTQAMTLDAGGNLGVGTTSPTNFGSAYKVIEVSGSSGGYSLQSSGAVTSQVAADSGAAVGYAGTRTNHPYVFTTNNTERARIPAAGGMVVGTAALATSATDGFLYVPTCAGTPTGTPTTQTGTAPIVVDTTNNKLYFYSGGQWRDAGP